MKRSKKAKKLLSVILLLSTLFTAATLPAEATAFSDVSELNAYLDAINYVSDNKLMVGTSDTQFSTGTGLTRAMIVSILYRKAGSPAVTSNTTPFKDVHPTDYFQKAVIWATDLGIVAGTSDDSFSPNQNVTREQASCFFQRFSKKTTTTVTKSGSYTGYADSGSVSNFAKESVGWAIANGLLETPSNKIRPTSHMSRGEAAFALTAFGTNVERILPGKDHFKFRNVSSNFSSTYYMTNNHYSKTQSRLRKKYYTVDRNVYNASLKALDDLINTAWKGHCFGMCATSILDKYGKIAFNENYGAGTTSISQVGAKPGTEQESALTYYHIAQYYDNLSGLSKNPWDDLSQEFNTTVKKLQFAKGPALLSFTSSALYSHAIIVNSCTWNSTGDRYYWKVYDPDTAQISQWTIKIENGFYYLPNGERILHINALANYTENGKVINELNNFDYLDIDGYQNLKSYGSGTLSLDDPAVEPNDFLETDTSMKEERRDPNTYSTIGFYLQDGLVITNDCGETLEWSRENGFTGDMEIYDFRPIIGNGPLQVYLEVPLSKTFTIKSPEEQNQYFTIVDQYRFQYATGFSGSAVLNSDGAMELEKCLEEFEVGYYCAEEADTQRLSGKNGQAVKIDYANGLLSAAGEIEQYTVTKTDASGVRHTTVHTAEAVVEEASSSLILEPEESSLSE